MQIAKVLFNVRIACIRHIIHMVGGGKNGGQRRWSQCGFGVLVTATVKLAYSRYGADGANSLQNIEKVRYLVETVEAIFANGYSSLVNGNM